VRELLLDLGSEAGKSVPVMEALQRACELDRVEIARQLFEDLSDLSSQSLSLSHMNLGKLYLLEREGYFASHTGLREDLLRHNQTIFKQQADEHDKLAVLKGFGYPLYASCSWLLGEQLRRTETIEADQVVYWASFTGHHDLSRIFWEQCRKPIQTALFAVTILRHMQTTIKTGTPAQRLRENTDRYEKWACGLLDTVEDEETALGLLSEPVTAGQPYHLLDLGMDAHTKRFLTHRYCQVFMDEQWRGGFIGSRYKLQQHFTYLSFMARFFFPWGLIERSKTPHFLRGKGEDSVHGYDVIYAAGIMAMSAQQDARKSLVITNTSHRSLRSIPAAGVSSLQKEHHDGFGSMLTSSNFVSSRWMRKKEGRTSKGEGPGIEEGSLITEEGSLIEPLVEYQPTLQWYSRIVAFYQIPQAKYFSRTLTHLAWVATNFAILYTSKDHLEIERQLCISSVLNNSTNLSCHSEAPTLRGLEILWFLIEIGMFIDQRHIAVRQAVHQHLCSNSWSVVFTVVDILFCAALCLRVATLSIDYSQFDDGLETRQLVATLYTCFQVIISLNIMLITLLFIPYLSEWITFGTLTIMVQEMVSDLITWLVFFVIVLCAFSFCLLGFDRVGWYTSEGASQDITADEFSELGAFWAPLWAVHGVLDPTQYKMMNQSMAGALIWLYVLFASIVLVNLLIAMFADTYARVKEHSEREYTYHRYIRIFEHRHILTTIPPPFNMPYALYEIAQYFLARLGFERCELKLGAPVLMSGAAPMRNNMAAFKAHEAEQLASSVEARVESLRDGLIEVDKERSAFALSVTETLDKVSARRGTMVTTHRPPLNPP
jgi:hypothetical protein